jgi:hypothetical protein
MDNLDHVGKAIESRKPSRVDSADCATIDRENFLSGDRMRARKQSLPPR